MRQLGFLQRFMSGQKSLERDFVEALLGGNSCRAIEAGKALSSRNPMFLVTSLLVDLLASPEDDAKKSLFLRSLERGTVKSNLIWMLYKRGLLIREMHVYVERITFKDHVYYLILKEACIHGHHELLGLGGLRECIEFLLDNLDDWDLYRYALDEGLELRRRETLNYEYYLIHKLREQERAIELLRSRVCFKEIELIAGAVGLRSHPDGAIDCVIQLERSGFSHDLLRRAYEIYRKDMSVFNTKVVIAALVSSRNAVFLGMALCLSFKHRKDHQGNYEIFLVFVFLCRYFCFYPYVVKCLEAMNVKNAQVPNLSFIWSDILIAKGKRDEKRMEEVVDNIKKSVEELENSIKYFVSVGNLAHAVDAVELGRSLLESPILAEMEKGEVCRKSPNNSFLHLLGARGAYLFEKMTVEKIPKGRTMFLTDFYVSGSCTLEEMMSSGLCNIDDEFKTFFEELVQYQEIINK